MLDLSRFSTFQRTPSIILGEFRIKDKILVVIVATGWIIILFIIGPAIAGYVCNRIEWSISISGDDLELEDTVDVLDYYDGTYIKTIHCLEKQDKIWFIGEGRSQHRYTIRGPGVEFHPTIKFHKLHPEVIVNEKYIINFNIFRNGDRWDATVTDRGYTEYYEDIENNEICLDLSDV